MTPGREPGPVMAEVLQTLRQSRALLHDPSPRNIDQCRTAIAQCVNNVAGLMGADRSGWNTHSLTQALLEVRSELSALAKLLDAAGAYRRDILKAISAAVHPPVSRIHDAAGQTVRRVHVLG